MSGILSGWKGWSNYSDWGITPQPNASPTPPPPTPASTPVPNDPTSMTTGNPTSPPSVPVPTELIYGFVGAVAIVAVVTFAVVHRVRGRRSREQRCRRSDPTDDLSAPLPAEAAPAPSVVAAAESTDVPRRSDLAFEPSGRSVTLGRVTLAVPNVILASCSTIQSSRVVSRRRGPFSTTSIPSGVLREAEEAAKQDQDENSDDYEKSEGDDEEE